MPPGRIGESERTPGLAHLVAGQEVASAGVNLELPAWETEFAREGAEKDLWDAALRLMGAAPPGDALPDSRRGVKKLIRRARPDEVELRLEMEGDTALPRYRGDASVWVRPNGTGGLALRAEYPWLRALVATLRSDGTLSAPEDQVGFGVGHEELTPQAREDLATVKRRAREAAEDDEDEFEDDRSRFTGAELLAVVAAPRQDPSGLVVTTVELYADGVWVNYLLPSPDPEAFRDDRWPDDAMSAAAFPGLELSDDLGTEYSEGEPEGETIGETLARAAQAFVPAVPEAARRLVIASGSGSVEIEVGER